MVLSDFGYLDLGTFVILNMLAPNANMEGLFHVKHESKNLETRKIHKRKKPSFIYCFENKKRPKVGSLLGT